MEFDETRAEEEQLVATIAVDIHALTTRWWSRGRRTMRGNGDKTQPPRSALVAVQTSRRGGAIVVGLTDKKVEVLVAVEVEQGEAKTDIGADMQSLAVAGVVKDAYLRFKGGDIDPFENKPGFGARQTNALAAALLGRAILMHQAGLVVAALNLRTGLPELTVTVQTAFLWGTALIIDALPSFIAALWTGPVACVHGWQVSRISG